MIKKNRTKKVQIFINDKYLPIIQKRYKVKIIERIIDFPEIIIIEIKQDAHTITQDIFEIGFMSGFNYENLKIKD
jgi:hypothetical protein